MIEKPGRRKARDPRAKKAIDKARGRKMACNSSDKSARRNAPLVKAMANRKIRRADRAASLDAEDLNADALRLSHARKNRHWGSENAAERRENRDLERADLDATAGIGPQGRKRAGIIANRRRLGLNPHDL